MRPRRHIADPSPADRYPTGSQPRGPRLTPSVRFLLAVGASFYGDWLTTVGLVVLLYQSTQSPAAPAGYVLARVLPRLLGPAPGGMLADRFPPAHVVASCSLLQGMLTASLIVFARTQAIWGIYVAVALAQFIGSASVPCHGAIIPRLVASEKLSRINTIYNGISASSIFVAPALGAPLLTLFGVEPLIAVDSATFFFAAILMLKLPGTGRGAVEPDSVTSATEGFRLIWKDPLLTAVAAAYFANAAVVTTTQAVLVVASTDRFGSGPTVGLLYSAVGAGGLLGTLALVRGRWPTISAKTILAAGLLELIPLGAFALSGSLWLGLIWLGSSAFGGSLGEIWGATSLQSRVARDTLGRVNAAAFLARYLGMCVGAVAAIVLVSPLGWERTLLVVCGGGMAVLTLGASRSAVHRRASTI